MNSNTHAPDGALDESSLSSDEKLFLSVLEATGRKGLSEYLKTEGVNDNDEAAKRAATTHYHKLPLLLDPILQDFLGSVLTSACGPLVDDNTRFPATLWLAGATDTFDGRDFLGNISQFVRLLEERATKLAAKKSGWVVEPTTNIDGHRINESTATMHALFLDCDGRGEWDRLLYVLTRLKLAHIVYQSGGWSPTTPKWRAVLPLAAPFDTSDEVKREVWKQVYHYCRVVFGSLGGLLGEGFDPCTDTPCNPWFLTERRNIDDTLRQITWQPGHSLDLMALVLALPPLEINVQRSHDGPRTASEDGLADEKLAEVIDALSKATTSVPSNRHELYLALPGVLLDRGVSPDEVLAIIEAVSLNYPRTHTELHADNMHGAHTTIDKWKDGGHVTRIGELNSRWPAIAQAVDSVLPSVTDLLAKSTAAMLDGPNATGTMASVTGLPALPAKKRRRKLSELGKDILPIVASMKRSKNEKRRFAAKLVDRILDGETFQIEGTTPEQVDALVCLAVEALGFDLPTRTWNEVLDLASVTLLSMDFTQDIARVTKAQLAFMKGQRKKREWVEKRRVEQQAAAQKTQNFFNAAKALKGNR